MHLRLLECATALNLCKGSIRVINVFSKTVIERYWFVYSDEVEIDGPFPTKEAAYEAARAHD
jgi:hypothetical protein